MIGVQVTTNLAELQTWLTLAHARHVPFAAAVALTRVAKGARDTVVAGLPDRFVVRGKRAAQSFRYRPARKADWPRTHSIVYTLAEAFALQERGGTKKPRGRNLGIPGAGTRPTPSTTITAAKRPKRVLTKKRTFLQTISGGTNAGADAILQRVGRARFPLKVLYILRPRAEVRPALDFVETVQTYAQRHYEAEFTRALDEAFRGSRR